MRAAEIPISSAASYQIKRQTMNRGGLISLLGTALMAVGAQGQDDSFCACSASSYTFTLNFTQTCPPIMVMSDGGVTSQICDIGGFGDTNTTDFVPVVVNSIQVVEVGPDSSILGQVTFPGPFLDGDLFQYVSVLNDSGNDPSQFPAVIQQNIFAENEAGDAIVNVFAIAYSNSCTAYPAIGTASTAGWVEFTEATDPPPGVCTAFDDSVTPQPSEVPTSGPSLSPVAESSAPTASPVEVESSAPTTSPVEVESSAPTTSPVEVESSAPTTSPVEVTDSPTEAPSVAPVETTMAPVETTMAPVATTMAPVATTTAPVATTTAPVATTTAPIPPVPTMAPTMMSMDMSMDLDFCMSMSMSMSMSMDLDMVVMEMMEYGEFGKGTKKASKKASKKEKSMKSDKKGKKDGSQMSYKKEGKKASKKESAIVETMGMKKAGKKEGPSMGTDDMMTKKVGSDASDSDGYAEMDMKKEAKKEGKRRRLQIEDFSMSMSLSMSMSMDLDMMVMEMVEYGGSGKGTKKASKKSGKKMKSDKKAKKDGSSKKEGKKESMMEEAMVGKKASKKESAVVETMGMKKAGKKEAPSMGIDDMMTKKVGSDEPGFDGYVEMDKKKEAKKEGKRRRRLRIHEVAA